MAAKKSILIAEDDLSLIKLLRNILTSEGYEVKEAHNGKEALEIISKSNFDLVLTDFLMPEMDGMKLVRNIRKTIHPSPIIILLTAFGSKQISELAMDSGADIFLKKPIEPKSFLSIIEDAFKQKSIKISYKYDTNKIDKSILPPFIGVVIASSTGGPPALFEVLSKIDKQSKAAIYIVQHGPDWMLESLVTRLNTVSKNPVKLAENYQKSEPGNIYIAPGDRHLIVEQGTYNTLVYNGPKENFVIPAADPLFRSAAECFGRYSIAVVLTGLGNDGTQGSVIISAAGGKIIVQDPDNAIASSMPRSAVKSGVCNEILPLNKIAESINSSIFSLNAFLQRQKEI